jgi:hypothetical protein
MKEDMDVQAALTGQYRAGLGMLRQCIERCPDEVWASGEHPRQFWRIAYHALFYTHLYLMPRLEDFEPWEKHQGQARALWLDDEEPPVNETTYSREEVLEYLSSVEERVSDWVAALGLSSTESGFYWYKIPKLDHQVLNVRHLGVHVGQLQELLYARGVDLDWMGRR